MRREETKAIIVVIQINVEGKRGRGIPKKRWLDTIGNYMRAVVVCIGDVENRDKWKFMTKMKEKKKEKKKKKKRIIYTIFLKKIYIFLIHGINLLFVNP